MAIKISGTTVIDDNKNLINTRINPRILSELSTANINPNISTYDQYIVRDQNGALAISAPTGTPVDGNKLIFRIFTSVAGAAITWDATYTPIGTTLPIVTVTNKMIYVGCIYNVTNTRWDVVAVTTQA